MAKCEVCGVEFDAVRITARFCSGRCKKRFQRGFSGTELLSGTKVSGTEIISGTDDDVGEPAGVVDVVKDLKLDMGKDLGIYSWSADGIFIRPDITIPQVQNIARMVHARRGRSCPAFNECR